ncbi:DUF2332 domain-containing protein [Thermoleophilia bacterium SCSIO 60948]|nr:DUF2332 domain-containing protein [Thermoleophilia bacterium SCSIO 60948]
MSDSEARERLAADLDAYHAVAEASPSPFYATLLARMREDVIAGGPTWELLRRYADQPREEYYGFRALAGVHHEVLSGERPELAAHYPSAGGDGDTGAAWPGVREAFADHDPELLAELRHPLQTNETSRCGALIGGFCEVAQADGLPIRALELGSSAGLNLHLDRYRYEAGGLALGPADSPIRFADYWVGGVPHLDAAPRIESRAGCDLEPVDPASDAGSVALQAYLFPDGRERLRELRAAIEIARERPVEVERASADDWVAERLAEHAPGRSTVVFHSIFWTYLPESVRHRIAAAIEAAGASATTEAPVHWLRYEVGADSPVDVELRLRSWPGGPDRLLGVGRHHLHPVRWVG